MEWRDCTGVVARVSNGRRDADRSGGGAGLGERAVGVGPYERTAMASISTTKSPAMALAATVERAG